MFDKKGMVLLETLLFLLICSMIVSFLFQCANAQYTIKKMEQKGFHDEEVKAIYTP